MLFSALLFGLVASSALVVGGLAAACWSPLRRLVAAALALPDTPGTALMWASPRFLGTASRGVSWECTGAITHDSFRIHCRL